MKTSKNSPKATSRNGSRPVMHKTQIDIPERTRTHMCDALNQSLADASDLKSQTKFAHWNVKGKDFYQLHLLFDTLAADVDEYADTIAERITALGGSAHGTVRMAASNSSLPEMPTDIYEGMDFVVALSDRFARFGGSCRENIEKADDLDDACTADLYTQIAREIDKKLYFLEAHIQGNPGSSKELTGTRERHAARAARK